MISVFSLLKRFCSLALALFPSVLIHNFIHVLICFSAFLPILSKLYGIRLNLETLKLILSTTFVEVIVDKSGYA